MRLVVTGALALSTGCSDAPAPVRYELEGAWFHGSGPLDANRCFPTGSHWDDVGDLAWTIVRENGHITGTDSGGCSLALRGEGDVLVGDGQTCSLNADGALASLGVKERRFLRFRLDLSHAHLVATFVDRHEPNPDERSVVCGFLEATVTGVIQ